MRFVSWTLIHFIHHYYHTPDFNCCVDASVSVAGMILECSRTPLMARVQRVCPVWWVIRGNGAGPGTKEFRTPGSSYRTAGYLDYRDPG